MIINKSTTMAAMPPTIAIVLPPAFMLSLPDGGSSPRAIELMSAFAITEIEIGIDKESESLLVEVVVGCVAGDLVVVVVLGIEVVLEIVVVVVIGNCENVGDGVGAEK